MSLAGAPPATGLDASVSPNGSPPRTWTGGRSRACAGSGADGPRPARRANRSSAVRKQPSLSTRRERQVLRLVAAGATNKAIGDRRRREVKAAYDPDHLSESTDIPLPR